MRLVDTSAWIEHLLDSTLGEQVRAELPLPEQWLVPTIVQFELSKWGLREGNLLKAETVVAFTGTCVIAALDSAIAVSAAALSTRHRLSTADAIIYATALTFDADLLTCDAHFKNLPHVQYIPKLQ